MITDAQIRALKKRALAADTEKLGGFHVTDLVTICDSALRPPYKRGGFMLDAQEAEVRDHARRSCEKAIRREAAENIRGAIAHARTMLGGEGPL